MLCSILKEIKPKKIRQFFNLIIVDEYNRINNNKSIKNQALYIWKKFNGTVHFMFVL